MAPANDQIVGLLRAENGREALNTAAAERRNQSARPASAGLGKNLYPSPKGAGEEAVAYTPLTMPPKRDVESEGGLV